MFRSDTDTITIRAVGDLSLGDSPKMLGRGVRNATRLLGGEYLFADVREKLAADLVFGNLEGVLSDAGYMDRSFHTAQLRGLPMMAEVLRRTGFTVLNVANNHIMQYGPQAFHETCEVLARADIAVVGLRGEGAWHGKPVVMEVKGQRVGLLGYADPDNYGYDPCYALNVPAKVLADVSRLRTDVDTVIVSLHWGDEFVCCPSPANRQYGHALIDAGADIVLGHHPHVVQRIERFHTGWICFSLGNFISDMVWNPLTREGLMVAFDIQGHAPHLATVCKTGIDDSFTVSATPLDLADLDTYVASDESLGIDQDTYAKLVRSRTSLNRTLGHLHLIRNAFGYHPSVYAQIWFNSVQSLVKSAVSSTH